ncbi:VOC family protein [Lysobacter antibioticus]|uniref:VOC family protein n=1 Tax=Lysobacter antibioticus TaxID=84531 RepID=UPI000348A4CE|nr:VOC family protein [Lysobacter antibioticus]
MSAIDVPSVAPPSAARFVPMLHVASVMRAARFYAAFDFAIGEVHREPSCDDPDRDEPVWAWLGSAAGAELMLVRADAPVDASAQGVLFYVYCDDVAAMRERTLAAGIDAGEIAYPFYRPRGEFRVQDPDGYVLMVTHQD